MSNTVLKVAIIGPSKSGKTKISNLISCLPGLDANSPLGYEPTAGTRILQFDEMITAISKDESRRVAMNVPVELWDCGGDMSYEACWGSIVNGLHGAIVVFDPTSKSQANEVRTWCTWFAREANLQDRQMIIVAHGELKTQHKPLAIKIGDQRQISAPIINVSTSVAGTAEANEEGGGVGVIAKREFRTFLGSIYAFHPNADFS